MIYSEQCEYCQFYIGGLSEKCENPEVLSKRNNEGCYDDDGMDGFARNYTNSDICNLNCKYFVKTEEANK